MYHYLVASALLMLSVHSLGTLNYDGQYYHNRDYHHGHMRQMLSSDRRSAHMPDDRDFSKRDTKPMAGALTKDVVQAYQNEAPITDGIVYRTLSSQKFEEMVGVVADTVPSPPVEQHKELEFLRIAMNKENAAMGRLQGLSRFGRGGAPAVTTNGDSGSVTVLRIDIGKWNEIAAENGQTMVGAFKVYLGGSFVGYQLAPLIYGSKLHIPWSPDYIEKGIIQMNPNPATAQLEKYSFKRAE